jgi:FAD/FMN-containing dehydrogenase
LLAFKNFVDYGYNVLGPAGRTNKETKYFELEIAVAQELLVPAAEKVKAILYKYRKQQVYTFFGVFFRFTNADNYAYLSPSSGQKVVYISVLTSKHAFNSLPTGYKNLYKEIEEALLVYGGKPHWGKINFLTYEKVKKLYGDDLAKFKKIKQKFDPLGLFINQYTKNLLEG